MLKDYPSIMQGRYTSFTSVENMLGKVVEKIMSSPRLQKLLYYTDKHALSLPRLTEEQVYELLNHQIRIVPQLDIEDDAKPYVIISCDRFIPFESQTAFRYVTLSIDILCPYKYWQLDDFKLRPYSIAGEIDALINHSSVLPGGMVDFIKADSLLLNNDLGGLTLIYEFEAMNDDITTNPTSES